MPPVRGRPHLTRNRPDAIDRPKSRPHKLGDVQDGMILGSRYRHTYRSPTPEFVYELPPALRRPCDPRPPPLKLSDMECVKSLGAGGFGEVMLVRIRRSKHRLDKPGCLFALKAIRRKSLRATESIDPEVKHDERSVLSELPWNPFIASIVQTFTDQVNVYMLLELIPGGDLRTVIQNRGPLDPRSSAFYFANIVAGISHLQQFHIVHRDLKPENILLGLDGYLVLTDFGSAAREFQNSRSWALIGSPAYMAPELVSNEQQTEAVRSGIDWYSAGVILYEMTQRNLPFVARSERLAMFRAATTEIPWSNEIPIGKNLKSLICELLTVDAVHRLGTKHWKDVERHAWLKMVDWRAIREKKYLAPYVPQRPRMEETWHKRPLPERRNIPGLRIAKAPQHLAYNDCFPEKKLL